MRQVREFNAAWTKEDADNELAKRKLGIVTPADAQPASETAPVQAPAGMTLGEAAERYLAAKARKRSLYEDERLLDHLKKHFGESTPLADITARRISEYKDKRLAEVRKVGTGDAAVERRLSAATVNRPLALLRCLLRLARDEWEAIPTAPRVRLERERGRLRWLKPDEAARLLEACRASRNAGLADLVEFSLFTGVRRGEALGLAWDRVDRARGVVILEGDHTKTDERREVPLNAHSDGVLARRWKEGAEYVFDNQSWDHYRSAWEAAVKRAKLTNFRFHDLRHTYASWLVQKGRPLKEVQEALGHKTLAMTLRYAHLAPDNLRAAAASVDDLLPISSTANPAASAQTQHKDSRAAAELVEVSQKSSQ